MFTPRRPPPPYQRRPNPLPTAKDWVYACLGVVVFFLAAPWMFKGFVAVMESFMDYSKWVFA
jgi:hypothetical protein